MKLIFLWAAGETVPFMAMRCDDVSVAGEDLLIRYGDEVITASEYAFYELFDTLNEQQEREAFSLLEQFHRGINNL